MAVETIVATKMSVLTNMVSNQVKASHGMNMAEFTFEVNATASINSLYTIAHLPSNARISGLSRLARDDLQTTGSPTFDIGTYDVADASADVVDSINDGIVGQAADNDVPLIKDPADYGKYLWELHGSSVDPGGFITIKMKLLDANIDLGGTWSGSIIYRME